MEPPAHPFALVFDVDGTLAPDTTTQFLASRGVDTGAFWARSLARMHEGWDPVTSYLHEFVVESAGQRGPFRRADMAAAARHMTLFPGVLDLFERLGTRVAARGLAAEFYLVSGGLAPIVGNLSIAPHCHGIWASDFDSDAEGRPTFPRAIIDFTDKTKPLIEISKGLTQHDTQANPFLVTERVRPEGFRIPFGRMLFTGDGQNDVPCFALLTSHGGAAVAVYEPGQRETKDRALRYQRDGRVGWVAEADYTAGGEGFTTLCAAVERLTGRVA
jgi:phosphoserine phosphatase